ncbi:transcription elongation factor GreB [Salinisphaera hydrothermalis]|uniref:Transcription elongation factor GreB n=1 Tax=Salinisphaera hydrothermalis (strain C41B8) TaxID=1304275 RepID=A0A084ILA6_SALHC|nr:transcription elongation factor GreB [Salinisphaera hydrothermalis]KEZ77490.1 transcription elongation factor GreB [Salinisphaera hydrothermalis C41B8]
MAKRDYITREGWQALADELDYLWREKRPFVVRKLADAAAEGDRSENAEYIYRKKELREIDRRVRYLGKRVDELTAVDPRTDNPDQVFFGAWVDVVDADDSRHCYRIVGADETDAASGAISLHSPVARALLGKRTGDVVDVTLPASRRELEIEAIHYTRPNRN